jgi:AcrR family transcriptional regulator
MTRRSGRSVAHPKLKRASARPRPAPGAVKAGLTRRSVLDAAARLFRERGYAAPSLRGIADAAGIQAGSVYYHFDSKEHIVAEVLRVGVESVLEGVATATARARAEGVKGIGLLEVAVRAHLDSLLTLGDYTSANVRILGHVPPAVRRKHLELRDRYEALWRSLLVDAKAEGVVAPDVDLRTFRLFLLGAMNGALEWFDPKRKSIERLARDLSRYLLYGVRLAPAEPGPAGGHGGGG